MNILESAPITRIRPRLWDHTPNYMEMTRLLAILGLVSASFLLASCDLLGTTPVDDTTDDTVNEDGMTEDDMDADSDDESADATDDGETEE